MGRNSIPCFFGLCLGLSAFVHQILGAPQDLVVHARRPPTTFWRRHSDFGPDPLKVVNFKFGLNQRNIHTLHDELIRVSDPHSSLYGAHWSPARVSEHFSPSNETLEKVSLWLQDHLTQSRSTSRPELSLGGNWMNLWLTIEEAESLLSTKFHIYHHSETGGTQLACEEYRLPSHLIDHIDLVLPSVHLDSRPVANKFESYTGSAGRASRKVRKAPSNDILARPAIVPVPGAARRIGNIDGGNIPQYSGKFHHGQVRRFQQSLESCSNVTTVACLRAMYGFKDYQLQVPENHSLAIVEFTPQSVIFDDLDLFFSNFSPKAKGARPRLVSISGGVLNQEDRQFGLNGESNLDLQYSMPLVHPLTVSLYQVGDTSTGGSFNNFLEALDASYCSRPLDPSQDGIYPNPVGYDHRDCGTVRPAKVISTSYGMNEADATPAYLTRQCNEYGKLGLMGTTFIFSSGDNGVSGNRGVCLNRDGTQSTGGALFNPSFPGTCPYVTSVGATQLPTGKKIHSPEVACYTRIHSGGGFSNLFKLPKYQSESVQNYFEKYPPRYNNHRYNNSRQTRGFPDLSANGANFVVAVDGKFGLVYGTSASAPVVASMLTMINDARIALGKSAIGFINPVIYSKPFQEALNDITNGTNPGCGTNGFSAVPGWDPVTGLGTPNFSKLLPLWIDL